MKDSNIAYLLQQFQQPSEILCINNSAHASFSESLVPLSNLFHCVEELEIDGLSSDIVKWLKLNVKLERLKLTVSGRRLNNFQELSSLIMTSVSLKTLQLGITQNSRITRKRQVIFELNAISMKPYALLCSNFFNIVDSDDINSFQNAVIICLQNFSNDLEYFELVIFNLEDLGLLNSLFQAIFACFNLRKLTMNLDKFLPQKNNELCNKVAESLGETLKINKSLRTLHFPALLPDYSPIVEGLGCNNIIEVFLTYEIAKKRIVECSDYSLVWRKILFVTEFI